MVGGIEKKKFNHDNLMRDYVKNVEKMVAENRDKNNPIKLIEKITLEKVNEEFTKGKNGPNQELNDYWKNRIEKAVQRSDDCPICFSEVGNGKPLYILSCSHLFHAPCLTSFEIYNGADGGCNGRGHACPVCRQNYEKKPLMGLPSKNQDGIEEGLDEG